MSEKQAMMHQITRTLTLALLVVCLPTAWAFAQRTVSVAEIQNGLVVADKTMASEGETVMLTVTARQGYCLREGSLLVESLADADEGDHAALTRSQMPGVGSFISLTQVSLNVYSFLMPSRAVLVSAEFVEEKESINVHIDATEADDTSEPVTGVTMQVSVNEAGTATIKQVNVPPTVSDVPVAVYIPAIVTDQDHNTYAVRQIASGTLYGQTSISDVVLPDTDEPIQIEEGAFLLDNIDGSGHQIACVHTPLAHLDDYALMTGLQEQYATLNIRATASPEHRFWTFSCGVDVVLPQGVLPYLCKAGAQGGVEIVELKDVSHIKANNGVLLACDSDAPKDYEIVARPTTDRPSGSKPANYNARSYEGNLLEPVVEDTHYESGTYYILHDNEFHPILQENPEVSISACKAVLHLAE